MDVFGRLFEWLKGTYCLFQVSIDLEKLLEPEQIQHVIHFRRGVEQLDRVLDATLAITVDFLECVLDIFRIGFFVTEHLGDNMQRS